MNRFQQLTLTAATCMVAWLVQSGGSVATAQVIVYGNAQPRGSYNVYPQYPVQQYSTPQYSARQYSVPQSGYSRVTPHSRVTAYNRVAPQAYSGTRRVTPSIQYQTHPGGIYFGGTPAYGNGLYYGNSGFSGMPGPPTAEFGATARGNFGR